MKRISVTVIGGAALLAVLAFVLFRSSPDKNARAQASTTAVSKVSAIKQLWHCGMHPQVIQDHPGDCPICHMALTPFETGGEAGRSGEAGIQIDPRVVQNMGVRTAEVTNGKLTQTVRAVGMLSLPEPGLRDVSLKVNGWIEKLYANQEGMHVHKGDPLFEVYSPDLQVAAQELISASKSLRTLPAAASDAVKQQSQSLIETGKRKLHLWDVADEDIDALLKSDTPPRTILFRSSISGHVEEKMVVEGASVQAGMNLLQIADHSSMWLTLDVYSDAIPLVEVGQALTATVEGVPGKTFTGTLTFIYPHLDHMTRTLKVRATLDNATFELKPGMYATAELHTKPIDGMILCPREAVIDSGSTQLVFVAEGKGHFAAKKVHIGQSGDGGMVEIVDGLAPGERVVTSGQFLMDVESRTEEAVMKLAASDDAPPMSPPMTPTTAAAKNGAKESLVEFYCPMKNASWLQMGNEIKNPYMGKMMLNCGEAKRPLQSPAQDSPLREITESYLKLADGMEGDSLDMNALQALNDAAQQRSGGDLHSLKDAISVLSRASDIESAREAFKAVSEQLVVALAAPQK